MALFLGLPGFAGTRKAKPIWILLEQETVSGSGINWAKMHVCTSLQTDNHASTPPLSFLQAGCPSCHPTNSVKALSKLMFVNCCSQSAINKYSQFCPSVNARSYRKLPIQSCCSELILETSN